MEHNFRSIISQMLQSGITGSEADILALLNLFFDMVTKEVTEGNYMNLPIVNIRPSIAGDFDAVLDRFDVARHQFKTTTSSLVLLKNKIKNTLLEKVNKPL